MSSMFCRSFLISTCQRYLLVWFDTKCDAKSGNSLSSKKKQQKNKRRRKKKTACIPLDQVRWTTPSLEVLVWYPVCTCYGISVTVRLCLKLKPNVCSALREVNCMLAIWSRVKDLRQACDMKCKSVFFFFSFLNFLVFFFVVEGFVLFCFFKRSVSDLSTITKPSL